MKHSALEICTHLIKYMKRYTSAVKYAGKDFSSRKGQTLDDFMVIQGNCGDELSLYLTARMCCKHSAVITKKHVHLGKGVFRGMKPKPVLFHHTPNHSLTLPPKKMKTTFHLPPPRCTNQNLHCPGSTPNPCDCLPILLILNWHLIGTMCTLRPTNP